MSHLSKLVVNCAVDRIGVNIEIIIVYIHTVFREGIQTITAFKNNKRCSDSMVTEIMRIHLDQKVFVALLQKPLEAQWLAKADKFSKPQQMSLNASYGS